MAEIARAGERAGVDVVLLTDHDSLDAARDGEEGWYGRTLLLAGHEVSPSGRNHLLVFGVDEEIDWRGRTPAQIAQAARDAGGFGFAAHPFSSGSRAVPARAVAGRVDGVGRPGVPRRDRGVELPGRQRPAAFETARGALGFIARPERHVTLAPRENLESGTAWPPGAGSWASAGWTRTSSAGAMGGRVIRAMGYARTFRQLRTHVLARSR